jgi:hypothetical protein
MRRRIGLGDVVADRFRLVADIGEGGMGRVFEAVDLLHDRQAAVKLISRRLAQDPEFRERFQREAQAAERANHPHVLPVWNHGAEGDYLYIATPLCDTDLAGMLEEEGRLDPETALSIIGQVAWALDWAHGRDVVHRDVKPENILLVSGPTDPHAYLADFGMAKVATNATLTQLGAPAGLSPAYAAPEQWRGERVTTTADQYALAATLYCCLAGHPPFWPARNTDELRTAHLQQDPPPISGESDPRLANASGPLLRGLRKDPADRYATCGELVGAVRTALTRGAPIAVDTTNGERADSRAPTDPEHPSSVGRRPHGVIGPAVDPVGETTYAEVDALDETYAEIDAGEVTHAEVREVEKTVAEESAATSEEIRDDESEAGARLVTDGVEASPRRRAVLIGAAAFLATIVGIAVAFTAGGGGGGGSGAGSGGDRGADKSVVVKVAGAPSDITVGPNGTLWTANFKDGSISHLKPEPPSALGRAVTAVPQVSQIAAGAAGVWAMSAEGQTVGIDPSSGRPLSKPVTLDVSAYDLAVGHGALWVANGTTGQVVRVPIRAGRLGVVPSRSPVIGGGTSSVAVDDQAVWAVSPDAGVLTRLDPATGAARAHWRIGVGAEDVVALGDAIWVGVPARGAVLRFAVANLRAGAPEARPDKTITVPRATNATLVAGSRDVAYVNLDAGSATLIDPAGARIRRLAGTGRAASAAALVSGRLWITDSTTDTATAIAY